MFLLGCLFVRFRFAQCFVNSHSFVLPFFYMLFLFRRNYCERVQLPNQWHSFTIHSFCCCLLYYYYFGVAFWGCGVQFEIHNLGYNYRKQRITLQIIAEKIWRVGQATKVFKKKNSMNDLKYDLIKNYSCSISTNTFEKSHLL